MKKLRQGFYLINGTKIVVLENQITELPDNAVIETFDTEEALDFRIVNDEAIKLLNQTNDEAVSLKQEVIDFITTSDSKMRRFEKIKAAGLIISAEPSKKHIVNRVDQEIHKYNVENGIEFHGIDTIYKYTIDPNYTHYNFCVNILLYNSYLWDEGRKIEQECLTFRRLPPANVLDELMTFEEFKIDRNLK